jgi:murein L,D-transpeptidase YcbB/YkuD
MRRVASLVSLAFSAVLSAAPVAAQTVAASPVPAQPTAAPPAQGFGDEKPLRGESAPASATPAADPTAAPKPKKKVVRAAPPKERGVVNDDPRPSFSPDTFHLTQGGAERYRQIARDGGWPTLPEGTRLSVGAKGPLVAMLRQRLALEGDIETDQKGEAPFDKPLAEAVKQFQMRHGLARTGIVAGATLKALNVPAEQRALQLQMSAARISGSAFAFGPRYVVVNLPSASVEAVEGAFVKKRYVAVVGKPANASPQIEARIGAVNINPTWTLPVSIVKNEIIPKMQRDPGYLSRQRIRILDGRGAEVAPHEIDWSGTRAVNFTFRQDSGPGNALGQIRIDMPNREAVYMHDTPSKRFFASQDRFYSHGCVRVQDVKAFAAWILEDAPGGWDATLIGAAMAMGERRDIRLPRPLPVAWVYLTGYVTDDGKAHFRDDIYGLDRIDPAAVAARRAPAQRPAPTIAQPAPQLPAPAPVQPNAVARQAAPVPPQPIDPTTTGSVPQRPSWRWW